MRKYISRIFPNRLNESNQTNRRIHLNRALQEITFCSNKISTSKYNVLSFIPKFIFEQARKYSNIFFLMIALLQQVPDVSPTGRFTTLIPWLIILSVSAIKEIIEDIKRTVSDQTINNKKVEVYCDNAFKSVKWKDIRVGDIVRIETNEHFPADLLLISSSEPNSICYIQTSNLDGETNLKIRQGLPVTNEVLTIEQVAGFSADIECEPPNQELYKFTGNLQLNDGSIFPLDTNQILLRGSQLRNTRWIYGGVIYTGHDTKLMRNSNSVPFKRSHVEKKTNSQIFWLFVLLLVICVISTVASAIWHASLGKKHWYLGFNELSYNSVGYTFLTFIILYNNLIPISLQVTLELVKFLQAYYINFDLDMYDEENDFCAVARTSNLNEELGQIEYVFSDKTGTLTRNQMEFKRCSIAGVCYGSGNEEKFNSYELENNLRMHSTREHIEQFLHALATCHTVIPEKKSDGEIIYQASSPDECALVQALRTFNVVFDSRSPTRINLKFYNEDRSFEILNVLEFNSVRKRVSVILRDNKGQLKLYCKGADSAIIPRLAQEQQEFTESTIEHVEDFAKEGLRTLLVSYRDLDENEYKAWNRKYVEATTKIENREIEVQNVAELIETEMFLLGATGIEDKLQIGVPDTISMLQRASIKVWVLTGDKMETAVNIGYSCKLLDSKTHQIHLASDNEVELDEILVKHIEELKDKDRKKFGLIIDAHALNAVLSTKLSENFLKLAKSCETVICCRATPKNKADVVEFVKKNTKAITLAVGDGANDVGMIQAAHVGVGIYGKEGMQALSASDYAIGQFRFLQNLLFVHGIWNYKRLCKVILYSFYKNICLYVIELWYAFVNGFSGQILFERWLIGLYNVLFTAAPPMAIGLFDRPVSAATMLQYPELYRVTQSKSHFNIKVFWTWMANAIMHSIFLYYICYGALKHDNVLPDGKVGDFLFMGNHVYTYCVIVVCLKSGLETDSWTIFTFLSIFGSILFWFIFLIIYSSLWPTVKIGVEMTGMYQYLFQCSTFWFGLIFVPFFTLLPDITYKTLTRTLFSTLEQEVQEKEKANMDPSSILMKLRKKLRLRTQSKAKVEDEPYRGYAFSQDESGPVRQSELIRMDYEASHKTTSQVPSQQ